MPFRVEQDRTRKSGRGGLPSGSKQYACTSAAKASATKVIAISTAAETAEVVAVAFPAATLSVLFPHGSAHASSAKSKMHMCAMSCEQKKDWSKCLASWIAERPLDVCQHSMAHRVSHRAPWLPNRWEKSARSSSRGVALAFVGGGNFGGVTVRSGVRGQRCPPWPALTRTHPTIRH